MLKQHALFDNPSAVFNAYEIELQLNKFGNGIVEKGSKGVSTITSEVKGETVTVLACCNAESTFIPPFCIMNLEKVERRDASWFLHKDIRKISLRYQW